MSVSPLVRGYIPASQLLDRLASVKSINEIANLGNSVLSPAQFNQFIRQAEDNSLVVDAVRQIRMTAPKQEIDRISLPGRMLKAGKDGSGAHVEIAAADYTNFSTATNELDAKELVGIVGIRDDVTESSIERGNIVSTILDLMGEKVGQDLEEFGLYADTGIAYATDDMLSKTDGWLRLSPNKVFGLNAAGKVARNFDASSDGTGGEKPYPLNMFDALIAAVPRKYISDKAGWRIWCHESIDEAYRDVLASRNTGLGDAIMTGSGNLTYRGYLVEPVPILEGRTKTPSTPEADEIAGEIAWLTMPNNTVLGIFIDVRVEPSRDAENRLTNWVVTMHADVDYADENASAVAFVDKANPTILVAI